MSNIGADNYGRDSGSVSDEDLVHPAYRGASPDSETPPRPGVDDADLYHPGVADPTKEVHGALGKPQTTLKHPNARLGTEGFPAGWTQASPNQTVAAS